MARDEEEPKIKIVDRRMLNEDERKGTGPVIIGSSAPAEETAARPKLEVVGGGQTESPESDEEGYGSPYVAETSQAGEGEESYGVEDEVELSEEEMAELKRQVEEEQFAAYEQQMGRPLTDAEKEQVRTLMQRQAESMSRLEVAPVLVQTISELARYATVHLGLVANPYTNLIARNDAEARLAIDAFGAMYDLMKNRMDARVAAELGRVLTDLRVNYTRITGSQITQPGGPRIIH